MIITNHELSQRVTVWEDKILSTLSQEVSMINHKSPELLQCVTVWEDKILPTLSQDVNIII